MCKPIWPKLYFKYRLQKNVIEIQSTKYISKTSKIQITNKT